MRYTDEQRNLAEGMAILIKLYYRLKETDQTEWRTDSVIRLVAELAYKVIPDFKKCLYIKSTEQPKLKFFMHKGGVLYVSKKDFRKFLYAMDAFPGEYDKDILSVSGISHEFKRALYSGRTKIREDVTMPKTVYRDSRDLLMESFIPRSREDVPKEGHYIGMVSPPTYREIIHFGASEESSFAKALYRSPSGQYNISNISLKINLKNTFLGLLQYFFVKYMDVFESFDRIALCEYEPCKKLIFDIRLGRRHFCSDLCRKKAHDALQDSDKLHCQNKQNVWIRRKSAELSINPFTVYKQFCDQCNHPVAKGGLCPILCDRNKKMYVALEQKKKLPRKRLHPEKFDKHLRPSKR